MSKRLHFVVCDDNRTNPTGNIVLFRTLSAMSESTAGLLLLRRQHLVAIIRCPLNKSFVAAQYQEHHMTLSKHTVSSVSNTDTAINDSDARFADVILNIGLDGVPQEFDNVYSIGRAIPQFETALTSVKCLNFKVIGFAIVASDTESTLVVRATHTGDLAACANWLAEKLNQDCIAVYTSSRDEGHLYGPRAAAWGEFNPEYFFQLDGTRLGGEVIEQAA